MTLVFNWPGVDPSADVTVCKMSVHHKTLVVEVVYP